MILIGVSAGTIGIISSNDETLQSVRTSDGLSESSAELLDLVNRSLSSAGWLIVLGVGVLVAETVAIILAVVLSPRLVLQVIVSIQCCIFLLTVRTLSFCWQDIIFSFVVAFFYGATGIACAAYAAEWGGPPPRCEGDDSDCDDVALTATIALSTVRESIIFLCK